MLPLAERLRLPETLSPRRKAGGGGRQTPNGRDTGRRPRVSQACGQDWAICRSIEARISALVITGSEARPVVGNRSAWFFRCRASRRFPQVVAGAKCRTFSLNDRDGENFGWHRADGSRARAEGDSMSQAANKPNRSIDTTCPFATSSTTSSRNAATTASTCSRSMSRRCEVAVSARRRGSPLAFLEKQERFTTVIIDNAVPGWKAAWIQGRATCGGSVEPSIQVVGTRSRPSRCARSHSSRKPSMPSRWTISKPTA